MSTESVAKTTSSWSRRTLKLSTLTMGLMAGLFYSFTVAVMTGLARADDRTFVDAIQRINRGIGNPLFGFGFIGAFGFTAASAYLHRRHGATTTAKWILAALGLYSVALAITFGISIPLNSEIDRAGAVDLIEDLEALRTRFENRWVPTSNARTVATTLAFGCLIEALNATDSKPRRG